MPEQGIVTRSYHYMFVKQGVPAVFLATGYGNGGEEAWKTFLSGNYHHPVDDMSQKIDWQAGARFAEANYRIARAMADALRRGELSHRPRDGRQRHPAALVQRRLFREPVRAGCEEGGEGRPIDKPK